MRISDWSSDVCSSDLNGCEERLRFRGCGFRHVSSPGFPRSNVDQIPVQFPFEFGTVFQGSETVHIPVKSRAGCATHRLWEAGAALLNLQALDQPAGTLCDRICDDFCMLVRRHGCLDFDTYLARKYGLGAVRRERTSAG